MLRSALMLVAVLLAGCDSQTPTTSQSEVDEALDSSDVGAHESGFLVAAADVRLVTAVLAADNAERVRANLPAKFLPTGCATATRDNAAVTLTFAGLQRPVWPFEREGQRHARVRRGCRAHGDRVIE